MSKKEKQETSKDPVEVIRAARDELMGDDIELAACVFVHKGVGEPQVWRKGHWYDAATLLNTVLQAYRTKAAVELN